MIPTEHAANPAASMEEVQQGWHELRLRVGQLEAEKGALEQENKSLRQLLERTIEHRQKSHGELVLLLTALVSKLPLNDIGVIVSRLVEHNTNVTQFLSGLIKGTAQIHLDQPTILQTLDQTKRDLRAALKQAVEELTRLDAPLERELLQAIEARPDVFFTPRMVRANRCFIKGHVAKERVVRDFGSDALVFFNDLTTDAKLNPRPKPDEIVLGFKNEFPAIFEQQPALIPQKRDELLALYRRVQQSKTSTEPARCQKVAFQRLSFITELLHYYEHQNTESPDVLFAQHLPALVEQIAAGGPDDCLDEKNIALAESLMAFVINPDHRQAIINNVGKSGGQARTLKYVLKLRPDQVPAMDEVIAEFLKHLIPSPPEKPSAAKLTPVLRLIKPSMQLVLLKHLMRYEKLRRNEAEALAKAIGEELGIKEVDKQLKTQEALPPESERQVAWAKIKDLLARRGEVTAIAAAIRERLNTKYDADEIRQSWITLTETDPLSLIKIFCHLPYLANGKTDSIARTVLETYVTRLTHPKYATTYNKVVNSLKTMFHAKPDSPTLVNFIALVKWVDAEAATKLCADIGMPAPV